jgi:hypothetical protein
MAKNLAVTFGVILLVVGVLGLLGGVGIVGQSGIFMTDSVHDWVHIVSGVVLLIVAYAATAKSAVALIVFGVVYLVVAILGFFGSPVLGFLNVNGADNWLHLVLGVVILWSGIANRGGMTSMPPQM